MNNYIITNKKLNFWVWWVHRPTEQEMKNGFKINNITYKINELYLDIYGSYNKPTIVFIGGTDENNISYKSHLILKKKSHKFEYNPYRLPYNSHMIVANEGTMDFSNQEQDEFIKKIHEYLKEK